MVFLASAAALALGLVGNFAGEAIGATAAAGTSTATARTAAVRSVPIEPHRVKWRLKLNGDYAVFPPAVGPDGTIYVDVTAGGLDAVSPDGTLKWTSPVGTGAGLTGPVATGADGTIYSADAVVSGGRSVDGVVALNPDGTQKWLFDNAGDFLIAGPTVGPDGNIYAVSDLLGIGFFSLSPDGALLFSTGRFTEYGALGQVIAFGPDRAYFAFDMYGVGPATIFGYTLSGTKVFGVGSPAGNAQPATGPNGNAVVPTFPIGTGLSLSSISPQGSTLWSFYEFPGNTEENPDVGSDNVAYTVRNLSTLFAMNPDGTERWRYLDPGIMFQPVVGPTNELVFMGGRVTYGKPGFFLGVGIDGQGLFRVNLPTEPGFAPYGQLVPSTPAFSADGKTAYSLADVAGDGSTGTYSYLYAIDTAPAAASVPAAPTGLTATAVGTGRIDLAWTDNATNESGHLVFRCPGARCTRFTRIATLGADTTSYSNTGLTSGSIYRYTVKAYNVAGVSAPSNAASARAG